MNITVSLLQKFRLPSGTKRFLHMQQYNKYSNTTNAGTEVYHHLNSYNLDSEIDWKRIREDMLTSCKYVTPTNIDASTLHYCTSHKKYDAAFDYINHLKRENIKLNLATIGKYFNLFYELQCAGKLTDKQKDIVWSSYQELKKDYKVFDAITSENIICAISVTDNWRECLNLLEGIKIAALPTSKTYSVTIAAAFSNKDFKLGWQLLEEMLTHNRAPYNFVRHAYWNTCNQLKREESEAKLIEFFKIMNAFNLKCDVTDKDLLMHTFNSINFEMRDTEISKNGTCRCCNMKLDNSELTELEFEELKKHFLQEVMIGKNIFYKTTPEELEEFKRFTSNMEKFDVVIDGLNVAYSAGTKQLPSVLASMVLSVVQHFRRQNQKVLVIGRKHMVRWHLLPKIKKSAVTFLTEDISHDDPYLLYCALLCGNNTKVISRDMMRSHLFLIKDYKHKILFHKWLLHNRHEVTHVDNNGKVFFKYPAVYNIANQKHGDTWHIPYEDNTTGEKLIKWLCIRKCK